MRKLFLIFLFILLPYSAMATSYYVCSTGCNDANDGTSTGQCVASITRAHALAGSNDTVNFCPAGTWTGTAPVLNAEAGVTYIGNDATTWGSGTRATLQSTGGTATYVVQINVSDIVFRGFDVDINDQLNDGIAISRTLGADTSNITVDNNIVHDGGGQWYYGIIGNRSSGTTSNVSITNNTVYNIPQEVITIYPTGTGAFTNVLIRGNNVYNGGIYNSSGWGVGIHIKNNVSDVIIDYNIAHNTNYFGIATESDTSSPSGVTIRYNIIHSNVYGIGCAASISGTTDVYGNILYNNYTHPDRAGPGNDILILGNGGTVNIYNNSIYNVGDTGYGSVYIASTSGTRTFSNNIIYTTNDVGLYSTYASLTHSNNLVYRASGTAVTDSSNYTSAQITDWDNTAIGTDPAFTGGTLPTGFSGTYGTNMVPNTDYFQLTVDSPAKDAGATLASYTGAINGAGLTTPITRPVGSAYDIGAYEYGTVAQSGGSAGQGFFLQGVTIR